MVSKVQAALAEGTWHWWDKTGIHHQRQHACEQEEVQSHYHGVAKAQDCAGECDDSKLRVAVLYRVAKMWTV